ncbi:hypothetical protein ACOSP7_013230 [Xanthoceras sorbifolium]
MSSRRFSRKQKLDHGDDEELSAKVLFHHGASTIFRIQGNPPGVSPDAKAVFFNEKDDRLNQVSYESASDASTSTLPTHQEIFYNEGTKNSSSKKGRDRSTSLISKIFGRTSTSKK